MKLLIAGSRSIAQFDLSQHIPPETDTIISGGASGIDTLAEIYADKHRISKYIIRPQYALFGRAAPLKRNCEMVDMADMVLIIWDGSSRGTRQIVDYASKQGKPFVLIQVQDK